MASVTRPEAVEAIYKRWADNTALASTRWCFANESFSPPTGQTWARLTVTPLANNQDTLGPSGSRQFRRRALIQIQIFAPVTKGQWDQGAVDDLVQSERAIYEGVSFSGIACTAGSERRLGVDDGWYGEIVEIPASYWETK